jgi:hypothetical protein
VTARLFHVARLPSLSLVPFLSCPLCPPLQQVLWDNLTTVAGQFSDSSTFLFTLDMATSVVTNYSLGIRTSVTGCSSSRWANTSLNGLTANGLDVSQFMLRYVDCVRA